jgi:predicted MFS family arabinose efflux permease
MKFVPLMIFAAISLAIRLAFFVPYFSKSMVGKSAPKESELALICIAIGGFGQLVGVIIHGKAIDKLGLKKAIYLNLVFLLIYTFLQLLYNHYYKFELWRAGLVTFFYGV